jgi:hypothetical protein
MNNNVAHHHPFFFLFTTVKEDDERNSLSFSELQKKCHIIIVETWAFISHQMTNVHHHQKKIICYLQAPSGPLLCICTTNERVEYELGTKIKLCCLRFC